MDRDQGEPDGKTRKAHWRAPLRDAEDADEEQEGADDFVEKSRGESELAEITGPPTVLPETAVPTGSLAQHDEIEDRGTGDGAEHLRDHVGDEIRRGHPARDENAEAHRWIDMAARDLPDAVGHGDDGEAKGRGNAEDRDGARLAAQSADDGSPATDKDKRKRADEFSNCFFHDGVSPYRRAMMPDGSARA